MRIRIRNNQKMTSAFDFAYESLLAAARKMDRFRILDMIETIDGELNIISEILHFYNDPDHEIYKENILRAQYILKERALYVQVYREHLEEFQQEIEDEFYERVK
jgi:hypothetical protein